jgi:hypothetical protein
VAINKEWHRSNPFAAHDDAQGGDAGTSHHVARGPCGGVPLS